MTEIQAVCAMPEVKEALTKIEDDSSGVAGINQLLINHDYNAICAMIHKQVNKDKLKDALKRILFS